MKIFIDTSAFIALFVRQEKYHHLTTLQYKKYIKQKVWFYTSNYIFNELFTRLIYDFGENIAKTAVFTVKKSVSAEEIRVIYVDEIITQKSEEIFLKFSDQKISFTNATTYTLCKDYKIDEIFTLDSDFKKMRLKTSPEI